MREMTVAVPECIERSTIDIAAAFSPGGQQRTLGTPLERVGSDRFVIDALAEMLSAPPDEPVRGPKVASSGSN